MRDQPEPEPDADATKESAHDALQGYPLPAERTPALTVKRCIVAMSNAIDAAEVEGLDPEQKRREAKAAYKLELPAMEDRDSIRAYIACVAHGIAINVIEGPEANKMLYAAQIAMSINREQKQNGRPREDPRGRSKNPKTKPRAAARGTPKRSSRK